MLGRRVFRYWARNYRPAELEHVVRNAGFEIVAHDFVWQTFENISGQQPRWIRLVRPAFRAAASRLEQLPLLRWLGTSQLVVARKR